MSPEKLQELNKLSAAFNFTATKNALLGNIFKDMPEMLVDLIKKKFTEDDLIEKIINIYDKHFTLEDVQDLNKFYASPIGVKLLSLAPQISCDMLAMGQEWGEQIAKEVIKEVEQMNDFLGHKS